LRGALEDDSTDARRSGDDRTSVTRASVLDSIAATIGAVPRVLLRDTGPGEHPSPIVRPHDSEGAPGTVRYRIDGEIARGGMGAVLKGRDPDLGRDVALKVLREDLRDNADLVRRFIEEAQIGGQLQHPGVVPIYELGTFADHRPFFSMKLVKGHTLAHLLENRKDAATDRPRFLSIFEAVAQTVAYAHARGVIHRDLKPSNVMVGSFGEVQVMDWGLAKVLPRGGIADDDTAGKPDRQQTLIATARSVSESPVLSRAGSVLGTPSYMSPEQARGEIGWIDERADVFALGSILCEILTGEPAFKGRTSGEIQRRAALGDLTDAVARLDGCAADIELTAIAKDCLAREAVNRPRHAGVVAERMTAYVAGVQERLRAAEVARAAEAVRAEEAVGRAQAERRARRFQVGLAASLLVLTTAGGLTFTYWLQERQRREARFAQVVAEATILREKAQLQPAEPAAWRDALAALERAEGQGPEDQVLALRREIQAGLDEAEQNARLRQQLVEIYANEADVGALGTDAAYAVAFRDAGLDLETLEPAEFARRLRHQGEAAAIELSAFLDDWSLARTRAERPAAACRRPLDAARLADPEPYRARLRSMLPGWKGLPQAQALQSLTAAPEAAKLPAPTAVLLGNRLVALGQTKAAVDVLRPAAGRHPGDLRVNYSLAVALERLRPAAREEAVRYYTAARALRPETAHELAHLLEEMGRGAEAEAVFRDLADRRPENPRHLVCLGSYLKHRGRSDEAGPILDRSLAACREAIRLKPNDAAADFNLGNALREQGKLPEAVAAYREAIQLRPDYADAHHELGIALFDQGKLPEAIAAIREAIRLKPDDAKARSNLGIALRDQGKLPEAIAAIREAIRLKPDLAVSHYILGMALNAQGKLPEAIAAYREAIRLQPDRVDARCNLGEILCDKTRDYIDAEAEFREAIQLRPDFAVAHHNLGVALKAQDKLDDAIAEFRAAIRLEPDDARAHANLGLALSDQRELDDAIVELRTAIRLEPGDGVVHYNLANALRGQGKLDDAIAEYRTAIRLQPENAEAHCNLGHTLRDQRKYAGALAELRKGHELGSRRQGWRYPSARWVQEAERLAALAGRLPALLKGDDRPRDNAERLALAQFCRDTNRHAAAARFWGEAVKSDPRLADDRQAQHRYNASCAAALAATGAGKDEPPLDDAARARLRAQAMEWLQAELAAWVKAFDAAPTQIKAMIAPTLEHWKVDADLAGIRDPEPLSKLAVADQKSWQTLWADVEALLKRAQQGAR
jgi:serine/threonine-protein kinase